MILMNKKERLTLSIIFSIVILLAAFLSFYYMQKGSNSKDLEVYNTSFESIIKEKYNGNEKIVTVNGKQIKISVINGMLYINDSEEDYFNVENIYLAGNYLILSRLGTTGEIFKFYDVNGHNVIVNYNNVQENIEFTNLRIENKELIADVLCNNCNISKVSFVYQNNEFRIKSINETKSEITIDDSTKKIFYSVNKIDVDFNLSKEKNLSINSKNISIKLDNGQLFVNHKNMGNQSIDSIYLVDNLIFISSKNQIGELYRVFDENGKEIIIDRNNLPATMRFANLRIQDNSLFADSIDEECLSNLSRCNKARKVELLYINNKIILRGIYTNNKEKFTKLEKNNFDGAGNAYIVNGKQVEFKLKDGMLYANNNKIDYFTPQYVYTLDTIIILTFTSQGKDYCHFFDENGQELIVNRNGISNTIGFSEYELVNNSLYAKTTDGIKIELVYENGIITIYRVY